MIVADASAVVHALLNLPGSAPIVRRLLGGNETLHAPSLLDAEVLHVLRRLVRRDELSAPAGARAVADLQALPMERYHHVPLLPRIWSLRSNLTAYDASYVALAEQLGATLVTRDRRLAAAGGHRIPVELV